MQLRKKILAYFLLATYLFVALSSNVAPSHFTTVTTENRTTHKHGDFEEVHHEHHFHVGVFHFLGHLLEKIDQSNDLSKEHIVIVPKTNDKKVFVNTNPINFYFEGNGLMLFEVDAESLPDPPPDLRLLQKFKRPNIPLRAPPALV